MSLAGGIPLGPYVVGQRLAVGGMGEIRLGLRQGAFDLHKPVAIKLLLPHLAEDPASVELFLSEARLAARMNHPNIVQIFDVGEDLGRYYIAMELVQGVSLAALVKAASREGLQLPPGVLEHIGFSLCQALHHAHEQRDGDGARLEVIHRDVTPHNVLASRDGAVKLTDFGIAKALAAAAANHSGTVRGKLEYLAPEQLAGALASRSTDIYSAGVTLFHLASGASPFRRESEGAIVRAIEYDALPSLRSLRPDLSQRFCLAVESAMARTPSERFATAADFARAIADGTHSREAERLGGLVRELCSDRLVELEQSTVTVEEALETGQASAPVEPAPPSNVWGRTGSRRWLRAGLGAVAVALVGSVVWGIAGSSGREGEAATASHGPEAGSPGAPPSAEQASRVADGRGAAVPVEAGRPLPPAARASPDRLETSARTAGANPDLLESAAGTADAGATELAGAMTGQQEKAAANTAEVGSPPADPAPAPAPRAPASAPTRSAVATAPARRRVAAAARPSSSMGYVTVNAHPWARVSIAGREAGETPLSRYPVPAGIVELRLHNPDTGRTVRKKVRVDPGKIAYVEVELR